MTRLDERYKQVKVIGSGSFGHAILCTRRCDSKDVVVKVMQPDSCNKHSVMNEVKILKHLCHPNIVTFLAAWREGSRIYICMEYADGGDLKLAIQQQKSLQTPFDERTIQCWMLQLSGALYYLHSVKVLHRDLKAANVFLTDDKKVIKLGDFGISKQLHSTAEFAKTALGTPFYLSPEIVSGKKYNAKSDIWAAGIIMHELMTFHYPFKAKTQRELFQLIKNGLRTSHPNLSHYKEGLVQLMESMLIVDTAYRYSALKVMLHESLRGKYLLGGNGPLQTPELPPLAGVARTEEEAPVSVTHSDGARVARSVPPPNTRHDRVLPKQRAASSRKSPSYAIAAVVRAACLKNFQAMLAAVAGGLVTVLQKVVFPLKQGRVLRIPYGSRHAWHPLPSYTPQNYTTRKKQNAQKMLQKVLENLNTTLARVDETGQEQIQSGKDGDFEDHMPELTGTLNKSLGLFSFKGHANMQGITVKDTLHTQAEGLFKVLDDLLGTALLLQLLELSEDSTTLSADYAYKASKLLGKDKTHYLHLVIQLATYKKHMNTRQHRS